jgi:hypothetical protein
MRRKRNEETTALRIRREDDRTSQAEKFVCVVAMTPERLSVDPTTDARRK